MNKLIVCLLLFLQATGIGAQQKVKVAAAANLRYVLEEIKKQYEKAHPGNRIVLTYGSSGRLTQQIINGAPFDVFMAADVDFPKKVAAAGFAAGEVRPYIYGKLVLWSLNVDLSQGLECVKLASVRKIAIADPKKAPYGAAAVEALKKLKLYDQVAHKIVWGENINQTAQFAFSGNAELGFIALSLALAPDMRGKGRYYVLPPDSCPPIEQACVLLKRASGNAAAKDFINYFSGSACDALWIAFGYYLTK